MVTNLPRDVEDQIERIVATGHYVDGTDVVIQAIALLAAREEKLERLRAIVAVGTEQEKRGEVVPYTPELFAEIKAAASAKVKAGHVPDPDVCP